MKRTGMKTQYIKSNTSQIILIYLVFLLLTVLWLPLSSAQTFKNNSSEITNPLVPAKVGAKWTFRGTLGNEGVTNVVTVKAKARVNGINCLWSRTDQYRGSQNEFLENWIAQDSVGNVWVIRSKYEGRVDNDRYITMPAKLLLGRVYSIDDLDQKVISRTKTVTVPAGTFRSCIDLKCVDDAMPDGRDHLKAGIGVLKSFTKNYGWELVSYRGLRKSSPLTGSIFGIR